MPEIFFDIFGRDHNVKQTFDEIDGKAKSVSSGMKGLAVGAAEMGIIKMGESTVTAFKDSAGGALLLQRQFGGTAEDASRMNYVLSQSGLTSDDTKKSFGMLSKTLVAAQGDTAKTAALTKELGFSFQDANGQILPMTDILEKTADKFATMPDGPEKTALALKLFGKAGQDMVPMLNKGGDSMRDLRKESDELGTTLSQDQVNAFKDARAEGRQWDADMRGLQVTIGSALLPALTGMEKIIHDQIIPVIRDFEGWFKSLDPNMRQMVVTTFAIIAVGAPLLLLVGKLSGAINEIIGIAKTFGTAFQALNAIMAANPILLVIMLIALLVGSLVVAYNNVGWFKDFVDNAFKVIQAVIAVVVNYVTGTLVPNFQTSFSNISNFIQNGVTAFSNFSQGVSQGIQDAINWVTQLPGRISGALGGLGSLLLGAGASVMNGFLSGLQSAWKGVTDFVGGIADWIAKNKGPEEYDRTLLEPHGGWIMGGLMKGMKNSIPEMLSTLGGVTDAISGHFAASATANLSASGAFGGGGGGKLDLDGLTLHLNADATMGTFKRIAGTAASDAIQTANDDLYRGRAR